MQCCHAVRSEHHAAMHPKCQAGRHAGCLAHAGHPSRSDTALQTDASACTERVPRGLTAGGAVPAPLLATRTAVSRQSSLQGSSWSRGSGVMASDRSRPATEPFSHPSGCSRARASRCSREWSTSEGLAGWQSAAREGVAWGGRGSGAQPLCHAASKDARPCAMPALVGWPNLHRGRHCLQPCAPCSASGDRGLYCTRGVVLRLGLCSWM